MKGFENIASTVEISPEWEEDRGCTVGVSIAEIINPNRIEGFSKFGTYKMVVLSNHIDIPIISDHKFKEHSFDDIVEKGYFRKSEIKNIKRFIVIKGIFISPYSENILSSHIYCSLYDKNDKQIASITESKKSDRAVFKYMGRYVGNSDISTDQNSHFAFVFGFNSTIQPSKIIIFPGNGYNEMGMKTAHWWWYMDKDLFPRKKTKNAGSVDHPRVAEKIDEDIPF